MQNYVESSPEGELRDTQSLSLRVLMGSLCLLIAASGCLSLPLPRTPVPFSLVDSAQVLNIERARSDGDVPSPEYQRWLEASEAEVQAQFAGVSHREHNYLAISGGGQNGAFAAGLLAGWTAAGTRPEFTIVTGTSTGALAAPFAFLGPDYDDLLEEMYTTHSTEDLIEGRKFIFAIFKDAISSSTPLEGLLEEFITDPLMQAIAVEHRKGRRLLIATTNLDTARPVIWNIGRIAVSGEPGALALIRSILLASASVPGAMPPVRILVEAEGRQYDELHTDGGVSSQVFFYPVELDWAMVTKKLDVVGKPNLYIIRNSRMVPVWQATKPSVKEIGKRSISSLIRTQGIGDLYRIYVGAMRDDLSFHLAYITQAFDGKPQEQFDKEYMTSLFEHAYQIAINGYPWKMTPPGYEVP